MYYQKQAFKDREYNLYCSYLLLQLIQDSVKLAYNPDIALIVKLTIDCIYFLGLLFIKKQVNKIWIYFYSNLLVSLVIIFVSSSNYLILEILFINQILSISCNHYGTVGLRINEYIYQQISQGIFWILFLVALIVYNHEVYQIFIIISVGIISFIQIYYSAKPIKDYDSRLPTGIDFPPLSLHNLRERRFTKKMSVPLVHGRSETLWEKIKDVPFLIILINKQNLTISQVNYSLKSILEDRFQEDKDLYDFLMNKLQFQLVRESMNLDYKNKHRKSIYKNDVTNKNVNEQQLTLRDILACFLNYHDRKTFQIYASHQWNYENILFLAGTVQLQDDDDDEILIILNDITDSMELQQKIIKNDFKSRIVESFSHEMRTPLNSAINYLVTGLEEKSIQQIFKSSILEPALNSLRLQNYLISDIIDFQQYYSDDLKIYCREFKISDLIEELTTLFKIQFELKKLGFIIDLSKMLIPTFTTDYSRLTQIIVNLIQNSLKYSIQGTVYLKLKYYQQQNMLKICIKDDGIGIEISKITAMQAAFAQMFEEKDFTHQREWTGLGLLNISVILSQLGSPHKQGIFISSPGIFLGTKVKLYIENKKEVSSLYQTRQTLQRIQTLSNNNCIGSIITVTQSEKRDPTPHFRKPTQCVSVIQSNEITSSQVVHLNSQVMKLSYKPTKLLQSLNNINNNNNTNNNNRDVNSIQFFRQYDYNSLVSQKSKHLSLAQIKDLWDSESQSLMQVYFQKVSCKCRTVLSVDDEVFNQNSVSVLLSQLGFNVQIAYNGIQALEVVKAAPRCSDKCCVYNFILMDYQMPMMDGIQTTAQIIQLIKEKIIPSTPIIGLTAFTGQEDINKCLNAGMTDVLSKPLNLKELKEVLSLL